jgi:hypothetical protein
MIIVDGIEMADDEFREYEELKEDAFVAGIISI